jgi:hypothetical protein
MIFEAEPMTHKAEIQYDRLGLPHNSYPGNDRELKKKEKPQKAGLPIYVVRWKDFMRVSDTNILFKLGVDKPITGCGAVTPRKMAKRAAS